MNEMRIDSADLSENIEAEVSLDCYQEQISEDLGRFQLPQKNLNEEAIPTFTKNKKGEIDAADFEKEEIVPLARIRGIDRRDCQFCQWKIHRIDFLRKNMHLRYFDAFNFYFAKPINEILANYQLPHVIALKDYQYLDESNEYLKRYYAPSEVPPRMGVLTTFFAQSYKPTRPNLMATSLYKVMQKHDYKKTKLFLKALSRKNGIDPHRQMPRFYNRNDDDTSESYISSSQSEVESQQNQQNNNAGQQMDGNQLRKRKNKLPSRIIYSNLSRSITMSCQNSTYQDNNNLQQLGTEYENYRNFILQISFESCEPHDVYNPQFSRSINSSMNRQQSQENLFADSVITSKSTNQKKTENNSNANNTSYKLDEPRLMELLMVNNKINSSNFDNLVEQLSLHDQKQLYSDLLDDMAAEKNCLSENSQDEPFDINAYIMGDFEECAKRKDPNGLFSSPSTSLLNNCQKTNTESRLMCSLSEFNNPNTQNGSIDKSSATTPYNNRSSYFLTSSKGNSNINNNSSNPYRNNANKSGGNANINNNNALINLQNCEGVFDVKADFPKPSSQFKISDNQPNLCRSNSDSKPKTSKSIQQVQQYILSQIKKQHDAINTMGSQIPNIMQLNLQEEQQYGRQSSVSPTLSPTNAKNLQSNLKKANSRQQSNASKRKLTDRNNTETNLGSVFEKLRCSMRMASQEGITQQIVHTEPNQVAQPKVFMNNFININAFNPENKNNPGIKTSYSKTNLDEFTQRLSTGEQIPVVRRGESGNAKGVSVQNQVSSLNKNTSPSASITPREISKKSSVNHFVIATESTPHQNTDQSPLLGGPASIWTASKSTNNLSSSSTFHQGKKQTNFQTIEKKPSQVSSNKRLVAHPKAGKNSSQDCSLSPTHFPHKFNSIPQSVAMFQGKNKSQGELPGTISTDDVSPLGNGHNNLLSFSQKILTLNQKLGQQSSKEESQSGKGILWSSELRNSINSIGAPYFDSKERKISGRIRTSNSPPPALSKFKKTSTKGSQDRIGSPAISGAQTARNERNAIPNSYFQHSNSHLTSNKYQQQQQQSIGSNSSSVHLLQSGVSHILQTDISQQSLMLNTTGNQQQQSSKQLLNSGNQKIDKQMTERILTNALTNTINKFYKSMTKSSDASEAQSLRASCKLNIQQPPQQPMQALQLQEVRHIQSEADLSPLLKQGARRQIQLRQSSDIIPGSRGFHSQKESIGSTASSAAAFQIGLIDQIQGKAKGAVPSQNGLIQQIYSSTGTAQMIYASNQHSQQQHQVGTKRKQQLPHPYEQQEEEGQQMSKGFSINNNNSNYNGNLQNNLNYNKNNNSDNGGSSGSSLTGGIFSNQSLNSQASKSNNNNWQNRLTKNDSESDYNNFYKNHLNMHTLAGGSNNTNNNHFRDDAVGNNSMQEEMEDITDTGVVQNSSSINININNNFNAASITNNHNNYGFPSGSGGVVQPSGVGIHPNHFKEPNIRFYEQAQNINSNSLNQLHQKTASESSYHGMMQQNMQKQPSVKHINNIIAAQSSKISNKNTKGLPQPHHTRGESQTLLTSQQQTKPQSKATSQHQYIQIKATTEQQQQQFQQQMGFHAHSSSHRIVKTEANEDTPRVRQSTQQEMQQSSARNFPANSKSKNENNQLQIDNSLLLSNRNSHNHIHSQPNNNQMNINYAEILPQDSDFKILHGASKMKATGTHFSPLKAAAAATEEKTNIKRMHLNEEVHPIWQVNLQNNFQAKNAQSSLLHEKNGKDAIQLGTGFYTQRNPPTKTRKQSDDIKANQQTKTIQSSRGSYQGQYGDISSWKQTNWNQISQPNLQSKASSSPLKQQPYQQVVPQQQMHQLHQSQSQTNLIPYKQPQNGQKKGNFIGGISQQQAAGLLNSKIKKLSQKI